MSEHTPGPWHGVWRDGGYVVENAAGHIIAHTYPARQADGTYADNLLANVTLFQAAPALLKAAKTLAHEQRVNQIGEPIFMEPYWEALEAAIKLAEEGESNG